MVVIEKMQLRKTTTFQLTFSKGANEKSCVFEINQTCAFGGKIGCFSSRTGMSFDDREAREKEKNSTSGAQFAALPLVKPVV